MTTTASDFLKTDSVLVSTTADGITCIGINRPHKKNAIDSPTAKKLRQAVLSFENDRAQKVCILHGIGGTFCSGFDLSELNNWETPNAAKISSSGKTSITRAHFEPVRGRNQGPLGPTRMLIKKPVICAIAGHAVAGGLELSLLADMRVVEDDSIFGIFSRRIGVPLLDGGTARLGAIVGLGRALDILLTGRAVGAREALNMGLASRVVPKGKAFEEAMKLARRLASYPEECLNVDRASCYYAVYNSSSLEDALSNEFEKGTEVADLGIKQGLAFAQGSDPRPKL
jgi:enoyl-CoA hydratase/carnithine racemase